MTKFINKESILSKKFSDFFIAVPVTLLICVIVFGLFYLDMRMSGRSFIESVVALYKNFPIIFAGIYLGLNACVRDLIRIGQRKYVTIPAIVYICAAMDWMIIWMLCETFSRIFSAADVIRYINASWIVLDIFVIFIFKNLPFKSILGMYDDGANHSYEDRVIRNYLISLINFTILLSGSILYQLVHGLT